MKFGKVLQQSMQVSNHGWEASWVDYKLLKKIIKDCAQIVKNEAKGNGEKIVVKTKVKPEAKEDNDSIRTSPHETNFFRTLRSEIKKIGDFFVREQAAYIARVKTIEQQFTELRTSPESEAKTEVMKSCVALYKELLLLENFAVMNFCGISKILKKHDKWTGYATRNKFMRTILMKQPFATYLPLLQMIDRLEQIFMEATGSRIDQHDAHRVAAEPNDGSSTRQIEQVTAQDAQSSSSMSDSSESSGGGQPSLSRPTRPGGNVHRVVVHNRPHSPEAPVSVQDVNNLRHNARLFEQTERMGYDGDDDNEGDNDEDDTEDGTFIGGSLPLASREAMIVDNTPESAVSIERPRSESGMSTTRGENADSGVVSKGYNSDSSSAAFTMLSMREAQLQQQQLQQLSDQEANVGSKRKACAPLPSTRDQGKRKMSFTTILN